MRKVISTLLAIFILIPLTSSGEESFLAWSPWKRKEKETVKGQAILFFDAFNKKKFNRVRTMVHPKEMTYQGDIWMSTPHFSYFLAELREKGPLTHGPMQVYSFDDCQVSDAARTLALKMYRVFDNYSLMATTEVSLKDDPKAKKYPAMLLFKKNEKTKKWYISALGGFDPSIEKKNPPFEESEKEWRRETIHQLDMKIAIPRDFSERRLHGQMLAFYMKGASARDAAYQISATKSDAPVSFEAHRWLTRILKHRRYTTVRVRFLPFGYRYECEILDRDKKENKLIVAAFRSGSHIVYVSFIGYMKVYEDRWKHVDHSLRSIEIR